MLKKVGLTIIGIVIMSFGITLLRVSNLGVDPNTALSIGLSEKLHLSLGVTQFLLNLILFIFIYFANNKYIGVGTLLNMVLVGYCIQFFTGFMAPIGFDKTIFLQLISVVGGLLILTFGAAIYMNEDLGTAPYDAVAPIISEKINKPTATVRNFQDIIILILAFFVHGPIGLGTVASAVGTGPLISFWRKKLSKTQS